MRSYSAQQDLEYTFSGSAGRPTVHQLNASIILQSTLEKGGASAKYRAVAEQSLRAKNVMDKAAEKLNLTLQAKSILDTRRVHWTVGIYLGIRQSCFQVMRYEKTLDGQRYSLVWLKT